MHLDLSLKSDLDTAGPSEPSGCVGGVGGIVLPDFGKGCSKTSSSKGREILHASDLPTTLIQYHDTATNTTKRQQKKLFFEHNGVKYFLKGHSYFLLLSF